jgi:hypothetical protein
MVIIGLGPTAPGTAANTIMKALTYSTVSFSTLVGWLKAKMLQLRTKDGASQQPIKASVKGNVIGESRFVAVH